MYASFDKKTQRLKALCGVIFKRMAIYEGDFRRRVAVLAAIAGGATNISNKNLDILYINKVLYVLYVLCFL